MEVLLHGLPVVRTLGSAYNVLITDMSDTMDIAYKNTSGEAKEVLIPNLNIHECMKTVFQTMVLISGIFYNRYSLSITSINY